MVVFPLKIVTPDGLIFEGPVQSVSCRSIGGQVELMARHIDYCTALGMGEAHITTADGAVRRAACMGGMLSMIGGQCRLLATTFEWAEEIDRARVEQSLARAETLLAQNDLDAEQRERAQARRRRALVRRSVAERWGA